MNEQRCCLSPEGKKELAQALKELGFYKETSQIYDRTRISNLTGIDRGTTIPKILKQLEKEEESALQRKKLIAFFEAINEELKERGLGELGIREARLAEQKYAHYIKEATFSTNSCTSPAPSVSSSPKQKLVKLLWKLDCSRQQGQFTTTSGKLEATGAFLVRAVDVNLEKWLIKRFALQIPGFGNAIHHEIFVPLHPMKNEIEAFWEDLGKKFLGENIQGMPNPRRIVNAIAACCETQTVILTLYGIQKLDQTKLRDLKDFWEDLVAQIKGSNLEGRLILFMSTNLDNCEHLKFPVVLEKLTWIDNQEVINWIDSDEIKPTLIELIGETAINSLKSDIRQCNPDQHSPLQPIEEICWACQLKFTDIEKYWELSA